MLTKELWIVYKDLNRRRTLDLHFPRIFLNLISRNHTEKMICAGKQISQSMLQQKQKRNPGFKFEAAFFNPFFYKWYFWCFFYANDSQHDPVYVEKLHHFIFSDYST